MLSSKNARKNNGLSIELLVLVAFTSSGIALQVFFQVFTSISYLYAP